MIHALENQATRNGYVSRHQSPLCAYSEIVDLNVFFIPIGILFVYETFCDKDGYQFLRVSC